MPREATDLVRKSGFRDSEKFYILSYEGTISEPKYFEDFRNSEYFNNSGKIEIIPVKRKRGQGSSSPNFVKNHLKSIKDEYNFKSTDEFWLIIDRDHWESMHNISFDELIEDCDKEGNFFVALSNPCFEIWLILHLVALDHFSDQEKVDLYNNLSISSQKKYIDEVLAKCISNGRGYNKKPDPKVFLPKIQTAIFNAKAIANMDERYPSELGSDIFKLIEKLII